MVSATSISGQRSAVEQRGAFRFLDPGPMVDRELELVAPAERYFDALLAACRHPLTIAKDPEWGHTDQGDLERLLKNAPGGHEPGDAARGKAPTYHFWMRVRGGLFRGKPPSPVAGVVSVRVGSSRDIEFFYGHVGYTVFPISRGRHYAERSCRLVFPLLRAHGLRCLWITTDPENAASRRTCERLGGELVETVEVPPSHPLFGRGQRWKCRYRVPL